MVYMFTFLIINQNGSQLYMLSAIICVCNTHHGLHCTADTLSAHKAKISMRISFW